jgi:hypothetical protein
VVTGAALVLGGPLLGAIPLASFVASSLAGADGALQPGTGLRCLLFEGLLALPPLAVAALFAWRTRLPEPRRTLMAAAAGGALAGQAALHVLCHGYQSHGHLFVFHTGGVLLALAMGALAARLLRPEMDLLPRR